MTAACLRPARRYGPEPLRWLAALLVLVLGATQTVRSQPARPGPDEELFMNFYKDPKPDRLVGLIDRHETPQTPKHWNSYPAQVGFYAVVFRTHPDRIERLLPARFNPRSALAVQAALQLSGQQALIAKLQTRLDEAGSDATLKSELAGLPTRLEELKIRTPTHLDILWGAAFASGDRRYPRMILDCMAQIANRSEAVALDVTRTAVAIMGGPKEILTQLRGKYGDAGAYEVIVAATALWALQANAQRHPFVAQVLASYVADNPKAHATKALSALAPRR